MMIYMFCTLVSKQNRPHIIYENAGFMAFLDINPIESGHAILIPKRHVSYVFDLNIDLYSKLFAKAQIIVSKLKQATKAKRIGLTIERFSIPHAHIHLVPVNKGSDLNPFRVKTVSSIALNEMKQKIIKQF